MTIQIVDLTERVGRIQVGIPGWATEISMADAQQAMEELAHILGFSVIDREERKSLLELAAEADDDDNEYGSSSAAWTAWQDRCEALSSAVTQALLETPPVEQAVT